MDLSRRGWLFGFGLVTMADIGAAQQHAHEALHSSPRPNMAVLDAAAAAELEALTSQIIPSDDSPGAREAGVVYFIDRALASFESDKRDAYRKGLKEIDEARLKLFPKTTSFAALRPEQQVQVLRAIEKTAFFDLLRTHTVWGFVGSPIYGGNHGKVGWKHIGFDDSMIFQPPFGYYDAV
jgi:gluconate 2-dehydrogenase gamma chain